MGMHQVLPFVLLFGSGLAALAYQMVWMREFRLVFGASTISTAAVSALFMAGLGIGGWILGKKADRVKRPLLMYGVLELVIAFFAAISPWLMTFCREYYLQTGGMIVLGDWGSLAARLGLTAVVIGVPTLLMGGTLPAAVRAVTMESDGMRRGLGLLYGLNTIGALTGTVLTNFWLMEALGARKTLYVAVVINLFVAGAAIAVSRTTTDSETQETTGEAPVQSTEATAATEATQAQTEGEKESRFLSLAFILPTAACLGFVFFLMELVWYRMLSPLLGGSTYTFGLILAVALAGIGLGGAVYPIIISRGRIGSGMLAVTCLLEALFMMTPYALGDRIAMFTIQIMPLSALGFGGQIAVWSIVAILVVFPASFIAGLQFPLLIALLGQGSKDIGVQTGRVYALNTMGAIAGSLVGGITLIPLLGAPGCWLLAGGILGILGVVIGLHAWRHSPAVMDDNRQPMGVFGVIFFVLLLPAMLAPGPSAGWRHNPIGAGRVAVSKTTNELTNVIKTSNFTKIWEKDGIESSVAIDIVDGYAFYINGKSDGSVTGDRGTQIMIGMIGAALHPNPQRSMVIGLGTGCTAGWLSAVGEMRHVDVVELEPAVLEMARLCAPVNHDVVGKHEKGQGVRIIINDAREVLSTIPEKYDIIVSEPSNPYRAGIASMFTSEFYTSVRNRLAPGGLFLSWCQAYEINAATATVIIATLKSVFPHVECWYTKKNDLAFVASLEPIVVDPAQLAKRLEQDVYRDAMRIAWGQEGFEGFVSHFVALDSFIDQVAKSNKRGVNTDDLMLIEYDYARSVGRNMIFSKDELADLSRRSQTNLPAWLPKDADIAKIVDNIYLYDPLYGLNPTIMPGMPPQLKNRLNAIMMWQNENYGAAAAIGKQENGWHRLEKLAIAESLAYMGDQEALKYIGEFEDWWPACAASVRANLAYASGNQDMAVRELEKMFTLLHTSIWEIDKTLFNGFKLADTLVVMHPQYAATLLPYIEEPFQLCKMEVYRRNLLLNVSGRVEPKKQEEVLQRWFEPTPPWLGPILFTRVQCYNQTQNRRLGRAIADLEKFNAAEPKNLDFLLSDN